MDELTPRQQEILDYIKKFYQQHGMPPTVREIGEQFQIASSSMFDHLTALQKKGYIKRPNRKSRSLELTEWSMGINRPVSELEIPILGRVAAGSPILAVEHMEGVVQLNKEYGLGEESFALRVKGDSMIDAHIFDGDLVIVQKTLSANNGDIIVALVGEEATVKRYFKESHRIRLQPENKTLEPIFIDAQSPEFSILGKVISVMRKL